MISSRKSRGMVWIKFPIARAGIDCFHVQGIGVLNKPPGWSQRQLLLSQSGQKARRSQFYLRLQRRPDGECLRLTGEIPKANKMPVVPPGTRYGQFIARNMEGCAFPAVGRFHLDQPLAPIRLETGDVVAIAVAILDRGSPYFVG